MEKGFFKFFTPETSAERMKIPTSFIDYKNGKLPRAVSLRDRYGNVWPIRVAKIGSDFYFQCGWTKFVEDNAIEFGDILTFDYDGNETFDVKLFGITECEKNGVGGLKPVMEEEEEEEEEEDINIEHQKSEEPKGKNRASDSISSSSSDDSDEDYRLEEEEEEEEEENEEPKGKNWASDSISSSSSDDSDEDYRVEEEEDEEEENEEPKGKNWASDSISSSSSDDSDEDYRVEEEEEEEEDDEEEEIEKSSTFNKASRSKAGRKRAIAPEVEDHDDQFGADIFKSGRATEPKNPYFVAKIQLNRKNQMHVPINVVREHKLALTSSMTIRDSAGREFATKRKNWKNGRICLIGGWSELYRLNRVEQNDRCICEFLRGKRDKGLYLQVQVLHEGASSRPNKKKQK